LGLHPLLSPSPRYPRSTRYIPKTSVSGAGEEGSGAEGRNPKRERRKKKKKKERKKREKVKGRRGRETESN